LILRELLIKLGLDVNESSFAKGQLAANLITRALTGVVDAALSASRGLEDALIGFNARAEQAKMGLAGIAGMNLKLPWEEAKKAADELYAGLQEDAAKTPAETAELVAFSQQIAGAYLAAGKNMKDLRQFTTQAVVAAKMLKAEGTAATDIKQAIQGRVGVKDMFAANIINSLGMSIEQFNAKSMKERADLFAKGLNNPTIRAAMAEYETQWDGVTSTIKDNIAITLGEIGKPLFKILKKILGRVGKWIQDNKGEVVKFFKPIGDALEFLYRNGDNVITVLKGITAALLVLNAASVMAAAKSAIAWTIAAAPFLAIGAAIAGILLFLDDIRVFKAGGDSVIGLWADTIAEWQKPNANDPWWLRAIKQLVIYMEKALGIADKLGVGTNASGKAGGQFQGREPLTGAKVPSPFISSQRPLFDSNDPNTYGAKFGRAMAATGSRWEGMKAGLGFGQYGADVPYTAAEYRAQSGGRGTVLMSQPVYHISLATQPGQSEQQIADMLYERIQSEKYTEYEAAMAAVSE
jgi:hypothetical protein